MTNKYLKNQSRTKSRSRLWRESNGPRRDYFVRDQSGFTIIESLVSILILTLALVPVISVISSATDISNNIRNNFVAANLAQEGIEVVRAIRDRNWFADGNPP